MNAVRAVHPGMLVEDVVSEHAEAAAFLWLQRERLSRSPRARLGDLARWDARLQAHLEGLFVAGERGLSICREVLPLAHTGEAFVLVRCALELGGSALWQMLEAVAARPELESGPVAALRWDARDSAAALLEVWTSSREATARRIALRAQIARRRLPEPHLLDALTSPVPTERALGLRAAGVLGRRDQHSRLAAELSDDDAVCRFEAARALVLLIGEPPLETIGQLLAAEQTPSGATLTYSARAMPKAAALEWHGMLAGRPESLRAACFVAAGTGSLTLLPWLIERLYEPEHHRAALDAIVTLTGLDIEELGFECDAPPHFASGPDDEPEHDDVSPEPDDARPWAEPARVAEWCERQGITEHGDERIFLGQILTRAGLRRALARAAQQARAIAAFELMRRRREPAVLFPIAAPASQQIRWLSAAGLSLDAEGESP